jgi:hypothetical protein
MFNPKKIVFLAIFIILIAKEYFVLNYEAVIILAEIILAILIFKNASHALNNFFSDFQKAISNSLTQFFEKTIGLFSKSGVINHVVILENSKEIEVLGVNFSSLIFNNTSKLTYVLNLKNEQTTSLVKNTDFLNKIY